MDSGDIDTQNSAWLAIVGPPPLYKRGGGGGWVEFLKGIRGSGFSHKRGGLLK